MVFTSKQKEELNKAILDYLKVSGYKSSADVFAKESETEELDAQKTGMLEKKWTSVVRLQKKVTKKKELKTKMKQDTQMQGL